MHIELTREFLDELRDNIEKKDKQAAHKMIQNLHPADIAELYGELDIEEAKFIYLMLDKVVAADVLIEMEEAEREEFLKVLSGKTIARQFINEMDSDDAADIIGVLSEKKQQEVLSNIADVEQAGDIVDLLGYDEDSAGGLMAKELIKVNENWNMVQCIREMRKQAAEVDEIYYVYAVTDDDILKGTVSLKRMLLSRPNSIVKNICNENVISVRTDTPSEEVAVIMNKYDLVVLPVIDQIGRLVGRITIDDVVDVMKEEAEKDYQLISGITEDVEPSDKIFLLTRARIPWLFIGLCGGILGARVISIFEKDIMIDPHMAFFIPLIAAMAGNVGVQSSAIVVQSIASNALDLQSTWKKLVKELSVAFINGFILAGLLLIYNLLFTDSLALTVSVSAALFSVIIFASVFGTFIPMMLDRFKIDPALATGPFITTINDITGLLIYLGIARMFYGIF
ncbi:MAG: magnesium transporter [Bacteroidales bacterium]|nr:magnesium transporter [Bacteroidales bacterium]